MHIIIAGSGTAAIAAAQKIREYDSGCRITVCSNESIYPYRRPLLPKLLSGRITPERFFINPENFYSEHGIEIRLNSPVRAVKWQTGEVVLDGNEHIKYDKLLLATGAECRKISLRSDQGVIILPGLHDHKDLELLQQIIKKSRHLTLIGGGAVALDIAQELLRMKIKVTIIERANQLLHGSIDAQCGEFVLKKLSDTEDLQIALNARSVSYETKKKEFIFEDSLQRLHSIKSDGVINCAGTVSCVIEFIPPLPDKAPSVDKYMRLIGYPEIFAAGDCVNSEFFHQGSYTDAIYSGSVAGSNIAGIKVPAVKKIREMRIAFNELKLYTAGEVLDPDSEKVIKSSGSSLQKLYYLQDKLIGCTLINDLRDSSRYYQAIAGMLE